MIKFISCLFLVFLLPFEKTMIAQDKIHNYYYSNSNDHLGTWHLKIKPDMSFEYSNYTGLLKNEAFGKIEKKGNKFVLKPKFDNYKINVKKITNIAVPMGLIWIAPFIYSDSTEEYNAYIIVDNDSVNKKQLHAVDGIFLDSNFKNFKIEIMGKFVTRSIDRKELIGTAFSLDFDEPFIPNNFLYAIGNDYYIILSQKKIKMYSKDGTFMFTMISKLTH